jgi:hypothetical protein
MYCEFEIAFSCKGSHTAFLNSFARKQEHLEVFLKSHCSSSKSRRENLIYAEERPGDIVLFFNSGISSISLFLQQIPRTDLTGFLKKVEDTHKAIMERSSSLGYEVTSGDVSISMDNIMLFRGVQKGFFTTMKARFRETIYSNVLTSTGTGTVSWFFEPTSKAYLSMGFGAFLVILLWLLSDTFFVQWGKFDWQKP